jgi:transcriptional regulator of acetoin/glycerol metabolism
MTLVDSIQAFRLRVLSEAQRSGNVSATCRRYGISRTLFYRWARIRARAIRRVRLISGTTTSLLDRVAAGTFSERLFYRLNIIHLLAGDSRTLSRASIRTPWRYSCAAPRNPARRPFRG